jgi:hypothetical protein
MSCEISSLYTNYYRIFEWKHHVLFIENLTEVFIRDYNELHVDEREAVKTAKTNKQTSLRRYLTGPVPWQ